MGENHFYKSDEVPSPKKCQCLLSVISQWRDEAKKWTKKTYLRYYSPKDSYDETGRFLSRNEMRKWLIFGPPLWLFFLSKEQQIRFAQAVPGKKQTMYLNHLEIHYNPGKL